MDDSRTFTSFFVAGLGALLLLVAVACRPAAGGPPSPTPPEDGAVTVSGGDASGWQEVDRLIDERKLQAALERVTELRQAAREAGDEAEWTRALVREVQLMTGLHGYERSVRHLKESVWPARPLYRAVLDLYGAQSLVHYLQVYGWEIGQRERVESPAEGGGEVDLRAWTREQIGDEIEAIYARLWSQRQAWGAAPLGELAEYFVANDYPPRIRGTVRDAVTYLWVERLADSSTWSAAEENGVYRLDLEALIDGGAPAAGEEGDPHPLELLAARLADLEAWHRGAGRAEAAFEARLERLRRLWPIFTHADDRATLRAALEGALDRLGRGREWWSVGQEQLARWVGEGDEPDSQIEARELALAGQRAHPESIGGRRCRHLVAAIEAPEYHLEAMRADGAHERSVRVRHRNLEALAFRAYRLDPLAAIEGAEDYNLLPGHREVEELLAAAEPVAAWRLELPATPDYRLHDTYLTPPVGLPGLYVLVASARGDFEDRENRKVAVQMVVGELVLLSRRLEDGLEFTVLEGESGAPAPGVEVRLYEYNWRQGHELKATRRSGADGTAYHPAGRWRRATYFAVAVRGDQVALDPSYLDLQRRREARESTGALIYTDRSVYRPGQEVLWKAVAYRGRFEEGSWAVERGRSFTVELRDANGELVESAAVTANDYGSASGRFTLPHGRLLGGWRLQASINGDAVVRVEEYKRPTFEVEIAEPGEPLRLNRPASLRGEARYYFGLPVAGGEVSWQVTREPVWSFRYWWWRPPPSSAPETVAAGGGRLAADGGFTVDFTPAADERRAGEGTSFRYRLSVDVTDEGGETRSASRTFRLGFVAVEAAIELERGFLDAGVPGAASIRRSDLDGAPRGGPGSWRLVRVAQPDAALLPAEQPVALEPDDESHRTPGDLLRPRWDPGLSPAAVLAAWPDAEELVRGDLEHGEDGLARFRLPALTAGVYRLRYETRDPWGARFESARELVVAEPGNTPLALPVVLLTERSAVPVGETIRLLVHSALDDQELVLELLRGERRIERRRLDSGAGLQIVELPVTAAHRGGLGVRLTALRDHQLMSFTESVHVPWDDRRLELSFSSFRDRLRPGTAESWRVTVRGAGEEALAAGAAELLAYMYDRSLDLFAPHLPPSAATLYPLRGAPRAPESSLGFGGEVWAHQLGWADLPGYPHLGGDRLAFYDGYDVGGPGRRGVARPMAMQRMGRVEEVVVTAETDAAYAAGNLEVGDELASARKVATPDPTPAAGEPPPAEPAELRTDFSETAFWEPHLVLGDDGTVAFEFTVPDSVTEWSVWVHALTRDLAGGSLERQARSVKELMVRPYLPRFLREGDRAVIKVVVNNASEGPLAGSLALDLEDPETGASLLAAFGLDPEVVAAVPFRVEPGGGAELEFELQAPIRVGEVAVRAVARAGELSDGELRPLPLLPGRLHLAQSRFATLQGDERRELTFPDLAAAAADPTLAHDQLVVTLDGQLFTSVLRALPYLVSYPYECTEQTANRFISTGILTSLYDDYPAVARLAKQLSERDRQFEPWDAGDPNRKMALVETPWRVQARGGRERDDLIRVLDPKIARAQERSALAKLEKSQTSLGAFPWWPGGPPSPYMTLYLLHGFAKAVEFEVEVPKPMVRRAWSYMHRHYLDELARRMVEADCCWEMITFLNYVLSAYPDDSWTGGLFDAAERQRMLEHSWKHWRRHSPYLKGYLALTLARAGRAADARLVFDAIMDSSQTDPDLGTYWAPEERAWLWYNDTIEGHAFALRTMTELAPDDARRHGLVQWLLLNKKLNHWKSTRATAEVLYAMVHYLEREGALGVREEATIAVGPRDWRMTFEPDELQPEIVAAGSGAEEGEPLGKPNQIVIPGPEVTPAMATVVVEKSTPGFLFASATWHFSTDELPKESRGDLFQVERRYFRRVHDGSEWVLEPLAAGARVEVGDGVEVHLSIRARHAAEYVHLRDPRGAGFEPETLRSGYKWDLGIAWYEEVRDSGTNFFFEWLPAGEYTFRYRLRATTGGTFRVGPATLQSMYAPEFTAYSAGDRLAVE